MTGIGVDVLYEKYITQEKPMHIIAKEIGVSVATVHKYLHKYKIQTREPHKGMLGKKLTKENIERIRKLHKGKTLSEETRKKISESHKKGGLGHIKTRTDGYKYVYFPDHPKSSKDGYIMEHVLVMEALIGRHLAPEECVHHVNEIKNDNRKENLQLMTKREHMSYHSKKRWDEKRGAKTYQ